MKKQFTSLRQSFTIAFFILTSYCSTITAQQIISVKTKSNALVLQVTPGKELNTIYLGEKLANDFEYVKVQGQFRQGTDYSGIYNAAYTPSKFLKLKSRLKILCIRLKFICLSKRIMTLMLSNNGQQFSIAKNQILR